jgi:transposase
LKPSAPTASHRLFVGIDSAYRDFTAALLLPGETARSEPKAFAQTSEGFEHLQQRLTSFVLEPASIFIVMEATGSYWIALAATLHQAGFAVSVINPAESHHFAKAHRV